MGDTTLYWHDYETFGLNPGLDQPAQFAGQRTDDRLNPIGEPLVLYCEPSPDRLPSVEACLVHGITPQLAKEKGVVEAEFIARIQAELSRPGTCGVGYNSLRFDDEVTRHTLFRNFHDPYAREWKNNCSRWDIIDLTRMTAALRPDGIRWPRKDDGRPGFKLTDLTEINGIAHADAHDALSDVQATMEFARLLLEKQPRLFKWLFDLRNKRRVSERIDVGKGTPLLYTNRMFSADHFFTSLVMPLVYESHNRNSLLVYDLRVEPGPFLGLSSEELHQRLFQPKDDVSDKDMRLPVYSMKINQCPAIAPVSTLNDESGKRLQLDLDLCARHQKAILDRRDFISKVEQAYSVREFPAKSDVDESLYNGFLDDHDRRLCQRIVAATPSELASGSFPFHDGRLQELLFRFRARNWPDSLSTEEKDQWQAHREQRYEHPEFGLESYFEKLSELRVQVGDDVSKSELLDSLEVWADSLVTIP